MRKLMRVKVMSFKSAIKVSQLREEPEINDGAFLIADEDGSEFERELKEAMEGLSVSATADKLSKVQLKQFTVQNHIPASF